MRELAKAQHLSLEDALTLESKWFGELAGTADFKEGTAAFMAKRSAGFLGR